MGHSIHIVFGKRNAQHDKSKFIRMRSSKSVIWLRMPNKLDHFMWRVDFVMTACIMYRSVYCIQTDILLKSKLKSYLR